MSQLVNKEHIPVLLNEVVESFKNVEGPIVDCTLGRGGHFFELLKYHDFLVGIDADKESVDLVSQKLLDDGFEFEEGEYVKDQKRIVLERENFININKILDKHNLKPPIGLLADLGISLYQIKESGRGFTFENKNEPLDMRIDKRKGVKASDLLNALTFNELVALLKGLAEVRNSKSKARKIVNYREHNKIETVGDLLKALEVNTLGNYKRNPATRVFMALRIAVNSEHLNLKKFLDKAEDLIRKGAVLDIITFHSLEERTVTNFVKDKGLELKTITPTKEEVQTNPSSRSSKLYAIKK